MGATINDLCMAKSLAHIDNFAIDVEFLKIVDILRAFGARVIADPIAYINPVTIESVNDVGVGTTSSKK